MATATFQTIVCNNPHGAISLHFNPPTAPNPFWNKLGKNMTANVPESLGGVTRTFSVSATVTLSLKTTSGTFTDTSSISSSGLLSLPFTADGANFTVTCIVT